MKRSPLKRKKGFTKHSDFSFPLQNKKIHSTGKPIMLDEMLRSGVVARASSFTPKKRPTKKRKSSGQAAVFKQIWDSRPHRCEVCDASIYEARAINFSHILPKGGYPSMKLDPRNIEIWCSDCHELWTGKMMSTAHLDQWIRVLDKYEQLKREANGIE